jgi:hypothetical protein
MRDKGAPVTSVTSVTAFPLNPRTRARLETENAKGRHTRHTCHRLMECEDRESEHDRHGISKPPGGPSKGAVASERPMQGAAR